MKNLHTIFNEIKHCQTDMRNIRFIKNSDERNKAATQIRETERQLQLELKRVISHAKQRTTNGTNPNDCETEKHRSVSKRDQI